MRSVWWLCSYPQPVMEKIKGMAEGVKVLDAPVRKTRDEIMGKGKRGLGKTTPLHTHIHTHTHIHIHTHKCTPPYIHTSAHVLDALCIHLSFPPIWHQQDDLALFFCSNGIRVEYIDAFLLILFVFVNVVLAGPMVNKKRPINIWLVNINLDIPAIYNEETYLPQDFHLLDCYSLPFVFTGDGECEIVLGSVGKSLQFNAAAEGAFCKLLGSMSHSEVIKFS